MKCCGYPGECANAASVNVTCRFTRFGSLTTVPLCNACYLALPSAMTATVVFIGVERLSKQQKKG
jgi:hypothetical protein